MRPLIALVTLCAFLASCNQPAGTTDASTATTSAVSGAKIGFVNTDSIVSGYTYLREQSEILEKRQSDASAEFERKARKFQDQVASFQRRAEGGNMTRKAMEAEQRVLAEREQELAAEQQRLANELQMEQVRIQSELGAVLQREVDVVQEKEGYDYIIAYGSGSPNVLGVNPKFEVTQAVLAGMNANTSADSNPTTAEE